MEFKYEPVWSGFKLLLSPAGKEEFCKLMTDAIFSKRQESPIMKGRLVTLYYYVLIEIEHITCRHRELNGEVWRSEGFATNCWDYPKGDKLASEALTQIMEEMAARIPSDHYKLFASYHGYPFAEAFEMGEFEDIFD